MFSKSRILSDNIRLFLQNRADSLRFLRHLNMSLERSSKVQAIYDFCKKNLTPSATPLSSQNVQKLCSLLDTVGPGDLGLEEDQFNRIDQWAQPITYINIFEGESFTICVLCFPTSSVIPLHDHPGMTVFSKVLYGSLQEKAYDWVEPPLIQESQGSTFPVRLAKLAVDKVLRESSATSVLYPKTGGNLHSFAAVSPCAVLDILLPPYDEDKGRRCTYYHDYYPCSTFSAESGLELSDEEVKDYAWLSKIKTAGPFMQMGEYAGPAIQT